MANFHSCDIHVVHQFDHMDCEFFQESLWIAASGKNRLLSYLKNLLENFSTAYLRTMINPAEPGISSFDHTIKIPLSYRRACSSMEF